MSNVLNRLKAGTAALLRGGTVAEIKVPGEAGEAVVEAVTEALQPAADAEAGYKKPKEQAADPADPADDSDDGDEDESEGDEPAAAAPQADARAAERARWAQVMGSPELAGRTDLAQHMLANTDLDAGAIIAALKAAPKAQAGGVAAMLGHDNPDLGAGGDAGPDSRAVAKAGWDKAIANLKGPSAK